MYAAIIYMAMCLALREVCFSVQGTNVLVKREAKDIFSAKSADTCSHQNTLGDDVSEHTSDEVPRIVVLTVKLSLGAFVQCIEDST